MKKILAFCGCLVVVFALCMPAQAVTITFDEYPPGTEITDLYKDIGVYFAPPMGAPGHDAEITEGGTWGITGNNGPQFLGCDGIVGDFGKSSGFVFEFDVLLTSFSFDFTIGNGTTTTNQLNVWPVRNGQPAWFDTRLVPLPVVNQWVTVNLSDVLPFEAVVIFVGTDDATDAYLGFDNVQFTAVPIPASALLLASGLIPLIRLRRKR